MKSDEDQPIKPEPKPDGQPKIKVVIMDEKGCIGGELSPGQLFDAMHKLLGD